MSGGNKSRARGSSVESCINFFWSPPLPWESGQLALPNSRRAPYVDHLKKWAELNPGHKIRLYLESTPTNPKDSPAIADLREALVEAVKLIVIDDAFLAEILTGMIPSLEAGLDTKKFSRKGDHSASLEDVITSYQALIDTGLSALPVYVRVDLARLLILYEQLASGAFSFSMYSDLDLMPIVLDNRMTAKPFLFYRNKSFSSGVTFTENAMFGFSERALVDLRRAISWSCALAKTRKSDLFEPVPSLYEEVHPRHRTEVICRQFPRRVKPTEYYEEEHSVSAGAGVNTAVVFEKNPGKTTEEKSDSACVIA